MLYYKAKTLLLFLNSAVKSQIHSLIIYSPKSVFKNVLIMTRYNAVHQKKKKMNSVIDIYGTPRQCPGILVR